MRKILILLIVLVFLGLSSCSSDTPLLFLVNHGQGSWDKNRGHRPEPKKKLKKNHLSCNHLNHSSDIKVCCAGVVQGKKGSASACCGYHSYDAHKEICCHGLIQRKSRFNLNCNNYERG
jgi:hypothetical protein